MLLGANQAIAIYTPTVGANNDEGVPTRTYAITANVVGYLHQKNATEYINGSYQVVEKWQALLPAGTVVDFKSVLQDENGVQYRVQSVAPHRDPLGVVHHISCMLVKAGA